MWWLLLLPLLLLLLRWWQYSTITLRVELQRVPRQKKVEIRWNEGYYNQQWGVGAKGFIVKITNCNELPVETGNIRAGCVCNIEQREGIGWRVGGYEVGSGYMGERERQLFLFFFFYACINCIIVVSSVRWKKKRSEIKTIATSYKLISFRSFSFVFLLIALFICYAMWNRN